MRRCLLPVAQRFPLGLTLIFATLFLSSVKSKLTAAVKDTKEKKRRQVKKPNWQTLFTVTPLILAQSGGQSSEAQMSESLLLVVDCEAHPAFKGAPQRGGPTL